MALNDRKHTIPASGEQPSYDGIFTAVESVNDIVPVADAAERTAVATAIGPTTARPLYVHRADAAPGHQLEVSTDGSTWRAVPIVPVLAAATGDARTTGTTTDLSVTGAIMNFTLTSQRRIRINCEAALTGTAGDLVSLYVNLTGAVNSNPFGGSHYRAWIPASGAVSYCTPSFSRWETLPAGSYTATPRINKISGGNVTINAGSLWMVEDLGAA